MISKQYKDKVFVVIAAYNEEKSISKVVSGLKKQGYSNIVVVDDCSKDKTFSLIQKLPVYALHHPINRGQGASLKTGMDYALRLGAEYIVTFDADGQHIPCDIDAMLEIISRKKVDICLGSRFLRKIDIKNVPISKRILLKGSTIVVFLFSGILLSDAHNGFRLMNRKAAKNIELGDRFEHASDFITEINKHKLRYVEVPVTILYTDYSMQKGQSIFNAFKILFRMIIRKLLEL